MTLLRFLLLTAGLLGLVPAARAQRPRPAAYPAAKSATAARKAPIPVPARSFFTTYTYLTYAITEQSTQADPIPAKGVGGTLTLYPDGTFQKRLTLQGNGTTLHFDQDGRFTFAGNRITFAYTDAKGQARTDEGTFRLQPAIGLLSLSLDAYPAGNRGLYTLRAAF